MNPTPRITAVQVCAAVQDTQAPWPAAALMDTPALLLARRTGLPYSACLRAVYRAFDDGFIDEGVSDDRFALADAGRQLLGQAQLQAERQAQQMAKIEQVKADFAGRK